MASDTELGITISAKDQASAKLRDVNESIGTVGKTSEGIQEKVQKAGLAIAAIGASLTVISKASTDSTVAYTKSVTTLSRQLGINVENTSQLVYVLNRSGISAEAAGQSLGFFQRQIVKTNESTAESASKTADLQLKMDAARNSIRLLTLDQKTHGDSTGEIALKIRRLNLDIQDYQAQLTKTHSPLQQLGIATKEADGSSRSFDKILNDVADKFKTLPNGAEKTAIAMELFGRQGKTLIPILNQGSDGIAKLEQQADKLGLTITSKNVAAVKQYVDAQKDLKDSQKALELQIGNKAIPMWQKLVEAQNKALTSLLNLPAPFDDAATSVIAFGGPVLTAAGSLVGFGANASTLTSSMPGLGGAVGRVASSFGALGGLMIGLPGLVLAVVAGTALLLNHFGLLKPLLDVANQAFQMIWSTLQAALKPALDSLHDSFIKLEPALNLLMPVLKYAAAVIGVILVGAIVTVVAAFATFVAAVAYAVAGVVGRFVTLQNAVSSLFNAIPGFIDASINTIKSYFSIFYNSGKALIETFGDGITSAFGKVKGRVSDGLANIRRLLPFSDAKEGPLSTLTLSGRRFAETFATGITQGAPSMYSAASSALSGLSVPSIAPSFSSNAAAVPANPAASNTGNNVQIQMNIAGNVIQNDAALRPLAVQMAQLVEQALQAQSVDSVNQLRAA